MAVVAALVAMAPAARAEDAPSPALRVEITYPGGYQYCPLFDVYAHRGALRFGVDRPVTLTVRERTPLGLVIERRQPIGPGLSEPPGLSRFPLMPGRWPLPGTYATTFTAVDAAGLRATTDMRYRIDYGNRCSRLLNPPVFSRLP